MLLATIYFTLFDLQWIAFLADPRNAGEAIHILAAHALGVPADALRLALYGAYPKKHGSSAVWLTFLSVWS